MSVPLDRLYNFLHDHCDQDVIIYRWHPHGSRKIEDCTMLDPHSKMQMLCYLPMICHDQEPLNFSEHQRNAAKIGVFRHRIFNLFNFYDRVLLLHSEQRSSELDKFIKFGTIPVYYWSHGMIARDWYRYAEHDSRLEHKDIEKLFLVYNRAWAGTREYRLKFAELVVDRDLAKDCKMGFNAMDQDQHYQTHEFVNKQFSIQRQDLEQHFYLNQTHSSASADYYTQDYRETAIEIVLETLFDDQRWHLTEKSLRPMACAQPFMLAAAPGSLEYLRSYGFKTFAPFLDEGYDSITDPVQRLEAIVDEMQRISKLGESSRIALIEQLNKIAKFNQQRFFSKEFFTQLLNEYQNNLRNACAVAETYKNATYFNSNRPFFKTFCDPEEYVDIVRYVETHTKNSTGLLNFGAVK